jgi:hypothetical protein
MWVKIRAHVGQLNCFLKLMPIPGTQCVAVELSGLNTSFAFECTLEPCSWHADSCQSLVRPGGPLGQC